MLSSLYPDRRYDSIYQIDLAELRGRGIRGILADLDNTLVPWRSEDIPEKLSRWLDQAREKGFKMCVISNAGGARAKRMAKRLGVPVVAPALKPRRGAFEQGVRILRLPASETAMIGDQVFMDILGANRVGLFTILVRPVSEREFIGTRVIRLFEKLVLFRLRRQDVDNI